VTRRLQRALIAVLATLAALLALSFLCAALLDLYQLIRPPFYRERYSRAPAFAGEREAAHRHFLEYQRLEIAYAPFVAWRYRPFAGETITVGADGLRAAPGPGGAPRVAFFGGSTLWGLGADDARTIPALVVAQGGRGTAVNFGQTGYNSRQELAQYLDRLAGGDRFDAVVFYDGVNDVAAHCRADVSLPGHGEEPVFRARLEGGRWALPGLLMEPLGGVLGLARRKLLGEPEPPWLCHRDPVRAAAVADLLLAHWDLARQLAEARGQRFRAFLQPVAYQGRPRLEGVDLTRPPGLGEQFAAVYPRLRAALAEGTRPWAVDLTAVLDGGEPVYFDFCHLAPAGNRRVAEAIAAALRKGPGAPPPGGS
jgi:hypothetical protein